jgi:P-type E1-E2 ATPase
MKFVLYCRKYTDYHRHSRKAQSIVLGLTADLNHPVAKAIYKHLQDNSTQEQVENVTVLVSKGIEGNYEGKVVRGGNCRWLGVESNPQVQEILTAGNTLFAVTMDDQVIAVFGLHSPVRSEAARVIRELQKRGITISIVSGDEKGAVESVAESMNVPLQNVRSRCSPSDKQNYIREALGPNCGNIVIFCGDGTNDAVALKQATIGVHMEGTDVAKSAANVVLVRPDLKGILNVLDISKAAYRRIWFNFAWSFIYNMLAVTMAAGAWEKLGVEIKPQYAALGELVSVLPVIAIAVQLRFVRFEDKAKIKKKEGEGGTGKDV